MQSRRFGKEKIPITKVGTVKTGKYEDHYENYKMLDKGAFARVYKAKHRATDKFYAAKCVFLEDGTEKLVNREISILQSLSHQNIMKVQ